MGPIALTNRELLGMLWPLRRLLSKPLSGKAQYPCDNSKGRRPPPPNTHTTGDKQASERAVVREQLIDGGKT